MPEITYNEKTLIRITEKEDGKNKGNYDGTYVLKESHDSLPVFKQKNSSSYRPGEIFFVKMFPSDERKRVEGFTEALAGEIILKLIEDGFIPEQYADCFSPTEIITLPNNIPALIQPFILGSKALFAAVNETQTQKNALTETANRVLFGQNYDNYFTELTKSGKELIGIPYILMIMIMLGNYSVHSGNIRYIDDDNISNTKIKLSVIDYGAAFRNFLGTDVQEDIWQSLEEEGFRIDLWMFKKYLEFYKDIPNLFSTAIKYAKSLNEELKYEPRKAKFCAIAKNSVNKIYTSYMKSIRSSDQEIAEHRLFAYIYGSKRYDDSLIQEKRQNFSDDITNTILNRLSKIAYAEDPTPSYFEAKQSIAGNSRDFRQKMQMELFKYLFDGTLYHAKQNKEDHVFIQKIFFPGYHTVTSTYREYTITLCQQMMKTYEEEMEAVLSKYMKDASQISILTLEQAKNELNSNTINSHNRKLLRQKYSAEYQDSRYKVACWQNIANGFGHYENHMMLYQYYTNKESITSTDIHNIIRIALFGFFYPPFSSHKTIFARAILEAFSNLSKFPEAEWSFILEKLTQFERESFTDALKFFLESSHLISDEDRQIILMKNKIGAFILQVIANFMDVNDSYYVDLYEKAENQRIVSVKLTENSFVSVFLGISVNEEYMRSQVQKRNAIARSLAPSQPVINTRKRNIQVRFNQIIDDLLNQAFPEKLYSGAHTITYDYYTTGQRVLRKNRDYLRQNLWIHIVNYKDENGGYIDTKVLQKAIKQLHSEVDAVKNSNNNSSSKSSIKGVPHRTDLALFNDKSHRWGFSLESISKDLNNLMTEAIFSEEMQAIKKQLAPKKSYDSSADIFIKKTLANTINITIQWLKLDNPSIDNIPSDVKLIIDTSTLTDKKIQDCKRELDQIIHLLFDSENQIQLKLLYLLDKCPTNHSLMIAMKIKNKNDLYDTLVSSNEFFDQFIRNISEYAALENDPIAQEIVDDLHVSTKHIKASDSKPSSAIANIVINDIPTLINLLSSSDNEVRNQAINNLGNLALDNAHKDPIREHGGIKELVSLLKKLHKQEAITTANIIRTLCILAGNNQNKEAIRHEGGIKILVHLLTNSYQKVQEDSLITLETLSVNNENKEAIYLDGGTEVLIRLLSSADNMMNQEKIISTLGILATGNRTNQDLIRNKNGIALLIALLSSRNPAVRKNSVKAICELSIENNENCDEIRNKQGIELIVELLLDENNDIVKEALGALWNLTVVNAVNKEAIYAGNGIHFLIKLLNSNDNEIMYRAIGVLRNLANNNNINQTAIRQNSGIEIFVNLLRNNDKDLKTKLLLLSAIMCVGLNNQENQQEIYTQKGISLIVNLLKDENADLRENAALTLIIFINNSNYQDAIKEVGGDIILQELVSSENNEKTKYWAENILKSFQVASREKLIWASPKNDIVTKEETIFTNELKNGIFTLFREENRRFHVKKALNKITIEETQKPSDRSKSTRKDLINRLQAVGLNATSRWTTSSFLSLDVSGNSAQLEELKKELQEIAGEDELNKKNCHIS